MKNESMKAILVERNSPHETSKLNELAALAETLDYDIVGKLHQNREPDPTYNIGKGKVQELAKMSEDKDAEKIIFANSLKPSQVFKIEKETKTKVIDRFQLILEIFAMRASSPEAKLQVEYAQLNYELPRIKESVKRAKLEEFPGLRGGGEYGESSRVDTIKNRMKSLEDKLESLEKAREERRKRRREKGFNLVAIAGYTNAGKSTLLNTLSSAEVEVDDRLFTTLSTRTRTLDESSQKILITDTIGFIDDLPPWMIEAFKAALEEIYVADMILLVVDASEPFREIMRKFKTSREILSDSSADLVLLLNKIDKLDESSLKRKRESLKRIAPKVFQISGREGTNLKELKEYIRSELVKKIHVSLETEKIQGVEKLMHRLHENTEVEKVDYGTPTQVEFWTDKKFLGKLKDNIGEKSKIKVLGEN